MAFDEMTELASSYPRMPDIGRCWQSVSVTGVDMSARSWSWQRLPRTWG